MAKRKSKESVDTEVALDAAAEKLTNLKTDKESEDEPIKEESNEPEKEELIEETHLQEDEPIEDESADETESESNIIDETPEEEDQIEETNEDVLEPEDVVILESDDDIDFTEVEIDTESQMSLTHRTLTIDGKTYAINRAQHKQLVTGNLECLNDIIK